MKQTTLKEKKALVQFVKQTLHSLVDEPSYQKLRKHITKKTFHSLQSLCKL